MRLFIDIQGNISSLVAYHDGNQRELDAIERHLLAMGAPYEKNILCRDFLVEAIAKRLGFALECASYSIKPLTDPFSRTDGKYEYKETPEPGAGPNAVFVKEWGHTHHGRGYRFILANRHNIPVLDRGLIETFISRPVGGTSFHFWFEIQTWAMKEVAHRLGYRTVFEEE